MKTRNKSYKDYGFTEGEARRLKIFCRSEEFTKDDEFLLWEASDMSNPTIKKYIYDSIKKKTSYDQMSKRDYIPIGKKDFYGYQRLCLSHMRRLLIERERW